MNQHDVQGSLLEVQGVTLQYKTVEHLITATYKVSFSVES
nr:ABC transporter ATP-binding protein [Candidimonas sp.]